MKLQRSENKDSTQKASKRYIFYTVLFMAVVIGILLLLTYSLLWGFVCVLLLLLSNIVRSVLKAFYSENLENNQHDIKKDHVIPLSAKDLYNSQKLLRYATAVLAFLSLMTTANGMSSFVFSEGWQAYLGSFGVQSILVVFSLLLCRFFVQITTLSWPAYIKKLSEHGLIIFFCAALIVSSIFSFSYIANNAYRDSWCSDSETIIQEFFLNEAYRLREENERRGKIILKYIKSNAGEGLKKIIDGARTKEGQKLNSTLGDVMQEIASNIESPKDTEFMIDEAKFLEDNSGYPEDARQLYEYYETNLKSEYDEAIGVFNEIVNDILKWQNNMPDSGEILIKIRSIILRIETNISDLESLKKEIEKWDTYGLYRDVDRLKGHLVSGCDKLCNRFATLKKEITQLESIATNIEKNSNKDDESELSQIISKVLLLGIGDSKEEGLEKDENKKVEDIITEINRYILNYSKGEMVSGDGIEKATSLNEAILLYRDYFELKNMIDIFCKDDMSKIYQIRAKGDIEEGKKGREQEEKEEDNEKKGVEAREETGQNTYVISEEVWKEKRNRDFYTFYSCVKKLPNIKGIEEGDGKDENLGIASGGMSESRVYSINKTEGKIESYEDIDGTKGEMGNYGDIEVIKAAEILQRDLLGELTDFEKALNYFKYEFPVMAFFAAGVAVFFDLSAFFTGCFLYATEYFNENKENP